VVKFLHLDPSRLVWLVATLIVVFVVAACGGDSSDAPVSTPTSEATAQPNGAPVQPTTTPVVEPSPSPAPTSTPVATNTVIPDRPQGPTSTDLSWSNGGVLVEGTLSTPPGDRLPAVLLIADGGGADRDWLSPSIPGINGSGRLMASVLVDAGYITLRYDRRGTGRASATTAPADGENHLDDSVAEISSAIGFLRSRPEVDRTRIYVVAHDEGALHSLRREQQTRDSDIAGIALLAPSALTLRQQVIRRLGELAEAPEDEPLIGAFDAAMAFFIADALPEGDLGLSPSLQGLFENLTHPSKLPYNTEIWNLDPVSLLPFAGSPVLVLMGQSDSELDWELEGSMWKAGSIDEQDVRFVYPANADHVLKETDSEATETGLSTYNAFGRMLDQETVDTLVFWLDELSGW
jgi:uncharacterized protein